MYKKRSSKEIIEQEKNPSVEHAYIKYPGKELIDISTDSRKDRVEPDWERIGELQKKYDKPYSMVHTHPGETDAAHPFGYNDIPSFLIEENWKTMEVAQTDNKTGKLIGYFVLRKTKKHKGSRQSFIPVVYRSKEYFEQI